MPASTLQQTITALPIDAYSIGTNDTYIAGDGRTTVLDIQPNSLDSSRIATNAITSDELADNSVDTAAIINSAITTLKILDGAVTSAKLADTSVSAGSYTFGSFTVNAKGQLTAASSGSIMNPATTAVAGATGLVPAPPIDSQNKFLAGDATFKEVIPDWTATSMEPGDLFTDPATNFIYKLDTAITAAANTTVAAAIAVSTQIGGGSVSTMTGATTAAAGTGGSAPAPAQDSQNKFLAGDATFKELIPDWTATDLEVGDVFTDPATNKIYRVDTAIDAASNTTVAAAIAVSTEKGGGTSSIFSYDAGNGATVWATGTGITFTKPATGEYLFTIPTADIILLKAIVAGANTDADASGDLYCRVTYTAGTPVHFQSVTTCGGIGFSIYDGQAGTPSRVSDARQIFINFVNEITEAASSSFETRHNNINGTVPEPVFCFNWFAA